MAQEIIDNLVVNAPKPLDKKYLWAVGGTAMAYDSVATVNSEIKIYYRSLGLTVLIDDGTGPTEYWYRAGITDNDLEVKFPSIPTLSVVAYTGSYTDLVNVPVFSTVASTGQYSDLLGKPNLSIYYLASNPNNYISGITDLDVTDALGFIPENSANKGTPLGYAPLDGAGKVPISYLPSSIFEYKGTWDASTNTPTLQDGIGDQGDLYRVNVAGTQDLGSGPITFQVGNYVIYNGSTWEKSGSTDAVSSVNGLMGDVVLTTTEITEGSNLYFTNARVQTFSDNRYLQIPTGTVNQYLRGDGSLGNIGNGLIVSSGVLGLNTDFTTLVNPTISTTWTLYKNDGTTPYSPATSTSKSITVDKGVVAYISSTYQYPTAGTGQGLPTSVSGNYGTTLPSPATPSSPSFTNGGSSITSNSSTTTTFSVTLAKPKGGLPVVGGYVTLPSGNDTTSDSTSINFRGRTYLILSSDPDLSGAAISALISSSLGTLNSTLQTGVARTINSVTSGTNNYTYYVHESAEGNVTNVIQNGALPVFTAFTYLANVTVTNPAGLNVTVRRFRSNAVNAFTAANLQFS